VKTCAAVRASSEAGFLLLEALIAVALVAICAGAALAAVVAVMHAMSRALPAPGLTVSAQNVLTDLRAATAYDPAELAALSGKSTAFTADEPAPDGSLRPVRITVGVTTTATGAAQHATVTATASDGSAVTLAATLIQEAPAPGSVVPAAGPTPAPLESDVPAAASTGIAL
jgi:Tfp pilus assembly protein PilV